MSPKPLVSFVIITYNRKEDLADTLNRVRDQDYWPLEIIVIDNNSTDNTALLFDEKFDDPIIRYVRLDENKGVAGGRNAGIKQAKGKIIVCIDDDALLTDPNATQKIVDKFTQDSSLGALAFKSVNYYTRQVTSEEFPHRDKSLDPNREFETSYFIGVAHAIKRAVYTQVGLYPENFFYAFEELDLSFRILNAGYKILYFPSVEVFHKKSKAGRVTSSFTWTKMLENRIKTSIRNLPWKYVVGSAFIWTLYVLGRTKGNIFIIGRSYRGVIRDISLLLEEREPVQPETIKRLKQLKGRLFY